MPEYIVNVDQGWPLGKPAHKLHDIIDLPKEEGDAEVSRGYLIAADVSDKNFTAELAERVLEHRKARQASETAEKKRQDEDEKSAKDAEKKASDAVKKLAEESESARVKKVSEILGVKKTPDPSPEPAAK